MDYDLTRVSGRGNLRIYGDVYLNILRSYKPYKCVGLIKTEIDNYSQLNINKFYDFYYG